MSSIKKNVASQNCDFVLVSTAGAAVTGATPTIYVTKDGTMAAAGGTTTELKVSGTGYGGYTYAPTQAETNCTAFSLLITNTGSVPQLLQYHTDVVDANGYLSTNLADILGTAVSTPATAGILDVNIKNMNNVAATSITTINANIGATQALTFDGNNYLKVDLVDIAGSAVSATTAQLGVNVVNISGTASAGAAGYVGTDQSKITNATSTVNLSGTTVGAVTAATLTGDLTSTMKASVTTAATAATPTALLTPGTGTGQVTLSAGVLTANTNGDFTATQKTSIGTAVAASNVAGVTGVTFPSTVASPTNITAGTITTVTNLTNAPTAGDFTSTMKTSLNAATPASVQNIHAQTGDAYIAANTVGTSLAADLITINNNIAGLNNLSAAQVTTACTAATPTAAAVTATVNANITEVNGIGVTGSGTSGSPWGPV